ncbi:MAG: hypothetical protein LBC44_03935 [Mycoplasmataceae bacterium]|nr:hypothetical protein [Mycoplasmataceae bacterium]
MENTKKRWEKRVDVFRFIYSLILKNEYNEDEVLQEANSKYDFDEEHLETIKYFLTHREQIIKEINNFLIPHRTWNDIKEVDKAILLSAISEFRVTKMDKKIIIDQAIVNAKNYSSENMYKFINSILDKVLN